MSQEQNVTPVTAELVPEERRLAFLPKHLGRHFALFEGALYHFYRKLVASYTGGEWAFYELSNGGFFCKPVSEDGPVKVSQPDNYFDDEMSVEAAGITACLYALCAVYEHGEEERTIDQMGLLKDYAFSLPDGSKIIAAID